MTGDILVQGKKNNHKKYRNDPQKWSPKMKFSGPFSENAKFHLEFLCFEVASNVWYNLNILIQITLLNIVYKG